MERLCVCVVTYREASEVSDGSAQFWFGLRCAYCNRFSQLILCHSIRLHLYSLLVSEISNQWPL